MLEPRDYLSVTVDPLRLAVLGHAAVGPLDVPGAGQRSWDLRAETAGDRRQAGQWPDCCEPDLTLDRDALRAVAQSLPKDPPIDAELIAQGWTEEEARILGTFFTGSRLKQIPTQRAKRLVVLERLAQEFEPGLRYQEKEVNFTLQLFYADYAALRRYLVDEELMTRADGVYWRSGGRFPK